MRTLLLLSGVMCICSGARAQDTDSLLNRSIDSVEVIAFGPRVDYMMTGVVVEHRVPPVSVPSLHSLLETHFAGVEFHQAGFGPSMSFRGLDARHVLFLLDGERMAGETYGNVDLDRIAPGNLNYVQVLSGPGSVLYGSNAMGAVVKMETRMPVERVEVRGSVRWSTPHQDNSGEAAGAAWSEGEAQRYRDRLDLPNLNGDLSVGFNLGGFRSLTSLVWRTSDAYKLYGTRDEERSYGELHKMRPEMTYDPGGPSIVMDGNGIPRFVVGSSAADTSIMASPDKRGLGVGGVSELGLSQKFEFTPSRRLRFTLGGGIFDKRRYDFLTSMTDDNPLSAMTSQHGKWAYEAYRGHNLKAAMEYSHSEKSRVSLSYATDTYRRGLDSLGGVNSPKQRHSYHTPRLQWTFHGGAHRLTSGAEVLAERLQFDLSEDGYGRRYAMTTAGVYLFDEISLGDAGFTAGVRGDLNDRFGWSVTPALSARYDLGKVVLDADYSAGYRTPSLKEMYMMFRIPTGDLLLGNEDLERERGQSLSFSARYANRWLDASAGLSHSWFRNKIDMLREGSVLRYDNLRDSRYGTLELFANVHLTRALSLRADYNYIFRNETSAGEATQYIFPSDHTATLSADYVFGAGRGRASRWTFWLNANIRYAGAKYYEDMMPCVSLPDGFFEMISSGRIDVSAMRDVKYYTGAYRSRHDGYVVCRAWVNVSPPGRFDITLGVDNIMDYAPEVVNFNGAMVPRRSTFIKLSFDL